MLARPGLDPELRCLVAIATATWRADWPELEAWAQIARERNDDRKKHEETLLQSVLFCGFPRVITAFEHFCKAWPSAVPPSGGGLPKTEQDQLGNELFAAIYGKNEAAVRATLSGYHQELHDFVLESAYGRILTRPALTGRSRELIAIAVLAAQDQKRQFAGHARGAMHLGASREELHEALVTAFSTRPEEVDAWLTLVRPTA